MAKSDDSVVFSGMNQRAALRIARKLGATVRCVRRTGEIRVSHPALPDTVKFPNSSRRKDSPRSLTQWLRRLGHALSGTSSAKS